MKRCPKCNKAYSDIMDYCPNCNIPLSGNSSGTASNVSGGVNNHSATNYSSSGNYQGSANYHAQSNQKAYCGYCGKPVENGKFCPNCGSPINAQQGTSFGNQTTNQSPTTSDTDTDMAALISNKSEYYMPKFTQMKAGNSKVSWNWCAFLVPQYWMLYRRLYLHGIIYWVASLLLALVPGLNFISIIALPVLSGLFGNNFYMQSIEKRMDEMKPLSPESKQYYLSKYAGTNTLAVVLAMVISGILGLIAGIIAVTSGVFGSLINF